MPVQVDGAEVASIHAAASRLSDAAASADGARDQSGNVVARLHTAYGEGWIHCVWHGMVPAENDTCSACVRMALEHNAAHPEHPVGWARTAAAPPAPPADPVAESIAARLTVPAPPPPPTGEDAFDAFLSAHTRP